MRNDMDEPMIHALAQAAMLMRHALEDDPEQHSEWTKKNRKEIVNVNDRLHALLADARAAWDKAEAN
jgi:hypothetical protein